MAAFSALVQQRAAAMLAGADPFFDTRRKPAQSHLRHNESCPPCTIFANMR